MRIWIDLDNSPHVHFFAPILRRLQADGVEPFITVRDFAQTVELARWYGMDFHVVGEHRMPRSTAGRVASTFRRAAQLVYRVRGKKPTLALSHGSRALLLASRALRIPAMTFYDYEFVSSAVFYKFSRRVFVPEVVPGHRLAKPGREPGNLVRYPGLKEEVYVYDFEPDATVLETLGLDQSKPIITVRPPATWAHYHNPQSESLFRALMERLAREPNAQVVVLSRTQAHAQGLSQHYASSRSPFRFPEAAVDALSLMCYCDFVFSGGGTMCREAALLGVKSYSTFGGRLGAADESLARAGRLTLLRRVEEIETLDLRRNGKDRQIPQPQRKTQDFLIDAILESLGSPKALTDPIPKAT